MSTNNQPAFPTTINREIVRGMTLRDYFAAKVLQGMYANPNHHYNTHPTDALEAYAMADAMMNFRERA
jgi:hypothetical protein